MNQEIEIPEGCEDKIVGNKVVFVPKESDDERIRMDILEALRYGLACEESTLMPGAKTTLKEAIAYLEKQKEQKTIEGVVKDITKNKEAATKFLKSAGIMDDNGELAEMYRSEQKPAELSEEDKDYFDAIIAKLEVTQDDASLTDNQMDFLKSLHPQPHWKHSKEQMEALRISYKIGTANASWAMRVLETLYTDLQKLLSL